MSVLALLRRRVVRWGAAGFAMYSLHFAGSKKKYRD